MSANAAGAAAGYDTRELAHFESHADGWWDPSGAFRTLHHINAARLDWIESQLGTLDGLRIADIGCGGGILAEAMAIRGARVTAIDLSPGAIAAAQAHAEKSAIDIDYRLASAAELATSLPGEFDCVTCLELLEHVPDPAAIITDCARLVRRGGSAIFSTINRTPSAYLKAILGAEYLLQLLPRETHDYAKFITPSELGQVCRAASLSIRAIAGLGYNPITQRGYIRAETNVNYLVFCVHA
jgi:2-polyprenyl-6-hydroxyphenyl methylase/3-demethylubiquinone-9 3-methyltransferase